MKIEKIASNKIKVLISRTDLSEWDIDFNSIAENTEQAQKMFWSAIKQAEKEVDFTVNGAQLLVEAMSNPKEGFFMMITKIDEAGLDINADQLKERIKSDLKVRRKPKPEVISVTYEFQSFEHICEAVRQIRFFFDGKSSIYTYENKYYLLLSHQAGVYSPEADSILIEFAHRLNSDALNEGFLNEHGKLIIQDNALDVVCGYF